MQKQPTQTFRMLLESLQPYPRMQFLLFAREWGEMEATLLEFCEEEDHSLMLYRLEGLDEGALPETPRIRQRPYRREQPRYNLQGKLYNHAFVLGEVPEAPGEFAKKVYTGIANAGGLYLQLSPSEAQRWEPILEASNYVALSRIDLDQERTMLYARKMHGWGG